MASADDKGRFSILGTLMALVGAGLIGAGVVGITRGLTFLLGSYLLFAGIAVVMYQVFVQGRPVRAPEGREGYKEPL